MGKKIIGFLGRCNALRGRKLKATQFYTPLLCLVFVQGMFVDVETMNGNNRYKCESCRRLTDATKGMKIRSLPTIFTVSLLRFSYDLVNFQRFKVNLSVGSPATTFDIIYFQYPVSVLIISLFVCFFARRRQEISCFRRNWIWNRIAMPPRFLQTGRKGYNSHPNTNFSPSSSTRGAATVGITTVLFGTGTLLASGRHQKMKK